MTKTEHEKAMLQQISDVAWLVHQGNQRVGILNKDVQEKYTYITGKDFVKFGGEAEVKEHFGNVQLFDQQLNTPANIQGEYYIRGYVVDYEEPFALEPTSPDYREDLPLYTKIENSDVYYTAGFYCINFGKGWKHAHGPKLSTILKYGYEGPFKNEIDARHRLKQLNKQRKNDE